MRVLPVVIRELRSQARLGYTYVSRMLAAGVLMASGMYMIGQGVFDYNNGGRLFERMSITMFLSIWILVPLLAVDSLSKEKREGTLGLLFLTPLKARDIVLAKTLVHGLRATMLWMSALPVLTIPFLLGGASWKEAVLAAMSNFSSLCWALGASILGSAIGKSWIRSLLIVMFFTQFFFWMFLFLSGVAVFHTVGWIGPFRPNSGSIGDSIANVIVNGMFSATGVASTWSIALSSATPLRRQHWLEAEGIVALASVAALVLIIEISSKFCSKGWQQEPPARWRVWLDEIFCTPLLWVNFFKKWMRRKLERNPIGWLEQRTWTGRLVTWGWLAVMISVYSVSSTSITSTRVFDDFQGVLGWLLIGSLAAAAAGSFRRERETGVLELILVSPVNEAQVLWGRLKGIWTQFLPAVSIYVFVWASFYPYFSRHDSRPGFAIFSFIVSFIAVPVIGLYFSLRRSGFIGAWIMTMIIAFIAPVLAEYVLGMPVAIIYWLLTSNAFDTHNRMTQLVGLASRLTLAGLLGRKLLRDLRTRNFSFNRDQN